MSADKPLGIINFLKESGDIKPIGEDSIDWESISNAKNYKSRRHYMLVSRSEKKLREGGGSMTNTPSGFMIDSTDALELLDYITNNDKIMKILQEVDNTELPCIIIDYLAFEYRKQPYLQSLRLVESDYGLRSPRLDCN